MKKLISFLSSNFQILNVTMALLIIISLAMWYSSQEPSLQSNSSSSEVQLSTVDNPSPDISTEVIVPSPEKSSLPSEKVIDKIANQSLPPNPLTDKTINLKLGHFPFEQAPQERLVQVSQYHGRREYLDREAAQAFNLMRAEAKEEGIELVLISGFRSISIQEQLFKQQIQKQGSKQKAAQLSAPPGHSEHHTGYAVDLGDGTQPDKDLKWEFEATPAYYWLVNNAHRYGFQLSFPRNNPQGVSFEPWHWRYVASYRAEQIFADALKFNISNP